MFFENGTWPMVLYNKGARHKPGGQEELAGGSGSYVKHKGLKISYKEKGEGEKRCNGSRERSKYLRNRSERRVRKGWRDRSSQIS